MDTLQQLLIPIGVIGFLLLLLFLAFLPVILYKVRANRLAVKLSWMEVLGLSIRKTLKNDILEAAALAVKENLTINFSDLEVHKMAGGSPLKVVQKIVEYKRNGKHLDFKLATAFELAGEKFEREWNEDLDK